MAVSPNQAFRYCPRCGASRGVSISNPLVCESCQFRWFFNPTCAAGAFLFRKDGQALFIRRANEPRKGTLALPGGFIDLGESAEQALSREIDEEVGLKIDRFDFVCSWPNEYEYAGIMYQVCDFIFTANGIDADKARPLDGVAGIEWHFIQDLDENELAFPSLRRGLNQLKNRD